MILGQANDANATTALAPTAGANNIPTMLSVSANMTGGPGTSAVGIGASATGGTPASSSAVAVKGDATPGPGIGAFGIGVAGSAATNVASVSATGVSGTASTTVTPTGTAGVDGVIGTGTGSPFAAGVFGRSDKGWGVFGDGGVGVDLAAGGTGRIVQVPLILTAGPPSGYVPNNFEQVRDVNGVIWVSNKTGAWRRLNSVIPITPVRLVDTRDGTGGGWTTPFGSGESRTFGPFPGIPSDAVGLIGNLTAAGFTGGGYVSIFPTSPAGWPGHSNLNFAAGFDQTGWANFFTVGLGTGTGNIGKITVRLSSNGIQSHVIIDAFAYIQ
jgi:hypothetical protein